MQVPPEVLTTTAEQFCNALKRDGFVRDKRSKRKKKGSSHLLFRREEDKKRVTVSFHSSGQTFSEGTFKRMLCDAGWASLEEDCVYLDVLIRVKLIKGKAVKAQAKKKNKS